jgi:dolichol-phosphate mannosyltransferase
MDKMGADAIMEFDADFQHDPQDIPRLIEAMDDGADQVIGSRYVKGGGIPKEWGLHRKIISRFGGLFAQIMLWRFDVHDMTAGYKLTKTAFLKKVDLDHLYSKYYAYKLHILHDVLKQGAKVTEVPIIFYERKEGSSKITRKDLFDSFWVVIRLRLSDSARFIKFLIVGGTGFLVQLIMQEGAVRLGTTHPTGVAIGAESAIISNFLFNNFWTFKETDKVKIHKENFFLRLVKFNVTSFASIIIQYFADYFAEIIFGPKIHLLSYTLPTRIVILIPTIVILVIPLNYLIYSKIIWKSQRS